MSKWRIVVAALVIAGGASFLTWTAGARNHVTKDVESESVGAAVLDRVDEIAVGQPQHYRNLTMIPLTGRSIPGLDYLTLDEAMDKGAIQVTEKGSGEVNVIVVRNRSGSRVFVMDGEEVVGAKQNRIVNSSLMIAPKQIAEVPVSCVEQGRWVAKSEHFISGGTQLFSRARQANVATVTTNYEAAPAAGPRSDQAQIWGRVAEKHEALNVASPSAAMHDAYLSYGADVGDYVKHFEIVDDQVGAVFAINGEIIGADVFDQSGTFRKLFPKLVKSYALDAVEKRQGNSRVGPSREDTRRFVRLVLQPGVSLRDYKSPGEGRDVRIRSRRVNGASLVVKDRAVHVSLFAPVDTGPVPLERGGVRPPSERRQHAY